MADVRQYGVTLNAVESVDEGQGQNYVSLGVFTFILHRLSEDQIVDLQGNLSLEINMTLNETGEFVVAIFDENDPEQKHRRKRAKQSNSARNMLHYSTEEEGITKQEKLLIFGCVVLACLYLILKIMLQGERDISEL